MPNESALPRGLVDYFNRVFWPRKLGRTARTRKLYLLTIAVFDRWLRKPDIAQMLGRPVDQVAGLDDLNDLTMCAFLQHRLEDVSPFSAAKDRSGLLAIANYAAKKRHLPEFLDVPIIPVAWPTPNAMRPEQFAKLLEATALMPGYVGGVQAPAWWFALLLVFVVTGERTEATLSLEPDMLGDDNWLRVPARLRKGRKKGENYFLPESVARAVRRCILPGAKRIFERSFCIETFYNRYAVLLGLAGLPTGSPLEAAMPSPHVRILRAPAHREREPVRPRFRVDVQAALRR